MFFMKLFEELFMENYYKLIFLNLFFRIKLGINIYFSIYLFIIFDEKIILFIQLVYRHKKIFSLLKTLRTKNILIINRLILNYIIFDLYLGSL